MASHKTRGVNGTAGNVLREKSENSRKPQMQDPEGQSRATLAGQRTRVPSFAATAWTAVWIEDFSQ